MSLPSRERGLKYDPVDPVDDVIDVAPFTGAWIEIISQVHRIGLKNVAPFTGAWIEM